jgi:hypothetical protein
MKQLLIVLPVALLLCLNCKKNTPEPPPDPAPAAGDTTRPVITITGNVYDTVLVGATYTDPGASANDNHDGNIISKIVVTGTVNTTTAANFTLSYNVSDQAGNQALSKYRFVNVKPLPITVAGNYSIACTCATLDPGTAPPVTANTTYTAFATVSPTNSNVFSLSALRVGSVSPTLNNVTISGNSFGIGGGNISTPGLQIGSGLGVTNGGTINTAKNSMTITTDFRVIMYPNMAYQCINVYTKF